MSFFLFSCITECLDVSQPHVLNYVIVPESVDSEVEALD